MHGKNDPPPPPQIYTQRNIEVQRGRAGFDELLRFCKSRREAQLALRAAGASQSLVALLAGVSRRTIWNRETDRSRSQNPVPGAALELARKLLAEARKPE